MVEIIILDVFVFYCLTALIGISILDDKLNQKDEIVIPKYYGSPTYLKIHTNKGLLSRSLIFIGLFIMFPYYYIYLFIYWLKHRERKQVVGKEY